MSFFYYYHVTSFDAFADPHISPGNCKANFTFLITFKDLQNHIQYIYTVAQTLDGFGISILKRRNLDNRILQILS